MPCSRPWRSHGAPGDTDEESANALAHHASRSPFPSASAWGSQVGGTRSERCACCVGTSTRSGTGNELAAGRGGPRTAGSGLGEEVVAIEVHDLVPRHHEVTHELLLPVIAGVDPGQRAELGMRAETEVGGRRGPLDLAR